jgi:hypothetical protein
MTGRRADDARPLAAVVLRPDDSLLPADVFGDTPARRAMSLADALLTTPGAGRLLTAAQLVVRTEPAPVIAVVGRFDPAASAMLDALGWQVTDALSRLLPVPYPQVETTCRALADGLRERLGEDALSRCRLLGVPRGGLIVAGMLAYCLGLPAARVGWDDAGPDDVLVLVDDCMLSGARTRRWLRAHPGPPVVLAHLHSHPDARAAAELDPRVLCCVAGADLRDHAPAQHGLDYEAWRMRWRGRSPDDYWTGHPDHVCYPWNEPDLVVWDDAVDEARPGWHVVPPAWCLKSRATAGRPQICPPAPHLPPGVLWAEVGDTLVVVQADSGTTVELDEVAADFWRAVVEFPDLDAAARTLALRYRVDVETLRRDLRGFVLRLAELDFCRRPASPPAQPSAGTRRAAPGES